MDFGIFDYIGSSKADLNSICQGLKLGPRGCKALTSLLCAQGLLTKDESGAFSLTPASSLYLCKNSEFVMDTMLQVYSGQFDGRALISDLQDDYQRQEDILASASRKPALDFSSGAGTFTKAMQQHSISLVPVLLQKYDLVKEFGLSGFLDVAGGSGIFWYILEYLAPSFIWTFLVRR